MRRTRVTLAAIAAVAALGLAACSSDSGTSTATGGETTSEEAGGEETASGDVLCADGGEVRIGIKFDQPGLGFQDGSDFTGFDVAVAKYVADNLGCSSIEFVESPSAQRETMLQTGQVDMIFATYSITDSRREVVDFAGPYFVAGQDLLVVADDTEINGKEDLDGKVLCSVTGSTSAERIKEEIPGVDLFEQGGYAQCVEVLGKQVDAVTTDDIILAGLAATPERQGNFKVVGNTFSEENYGVGLPKGSKATCEAVNNAIEEMISSGEWEKAVTAATEGTGYVPNPDLNPPVPFGCE